MQPHESSESPAPTRPDLGTDVTSTSGMEPDRPAGMPGDDGVIVATLVDGVAWRRPRQRLWTPVAVVLLSLAMIIFLSIVMRVATVWVLDDGTSSFRELMELERLKDAFRSRLGLFLLVVIPQIGLVIPALLAAVLSPHPFRERLGLMRGRWPVWAWVAAAAATPLVGLISSVFFGWFLEESASLREMGEIFRLHGQGGFLIPLALMIGATPALCEELLFRGYVQTRLTKSLHPWVGILLASLLFAIFHMDFVHALAVLPLGLFLGSVTWISGSLYPAMLGHFVNNAISVILMSFASEGDAMTLSAPGVLAVLSILGTGFVGILAVVAATVLYGWPHRPGLVPPATPLA